MDLAAYVLSNENEHLEGIESLGFNVSGLIEKVKRTLSKLDNEKIEVMRKSKNSMPEVNLFG